MDLLSWAFEVIRRGETVALRDRLISVVGTVMEKQMRALAERFKEKFQPEPILIYIFQLLENARKFHVASLRDSFSGLDFRARTNERDIIVDLGFVNAEEGTHFHDLIGTYSTIVSDDPGNDKELMRFLSGETAAGFLLKKFKFENSQCTGQDIYRAFYFSLAAEFIPHLIRQLVKRESFARFPKRIPFTLRMSFGGPILPFGVAAWPVAVLDPQTSTDHPLREFYLEANQEFYKWK